MPSLYQIKKALMYPRKLYMRRKENFEGFILSAMELHYYRPTMYRWLAARVENDLLLHEADIEPDSLVLDVGAYTGDWAREMAQLYDPRIIAFEPDPRNYRQLQQKAAKNPKLEPHEYGLGDSNKILPMRLQFLGSTIFDTSSGDTQADTANVEIRDIEEVWDFFGLDRVDVMKINIEGAEFPLLERMIECDLLKKVNCFIIQFHEWHPGAYRRRKKIQRELRKTHQLIWDYPFVWEKWEQKQ